MAADLEARSYTSKGGRKENQDFLRYDVNKCVFVIADGMGGHAGGRDAGRYAANTYYDMICRLKAGLDSEKINPERIKVLIQGRAEALNRRIIGLGNDYEIKNCGTTLDAVLIHEKSAYICHIGDGSIFYIDRSAKSLSKLTREHIRHLSNENSPSIDLILSKNDIVNGDLVSHLGIENPRIDTSEKKLGYDYAMILATDGLTAAVTDDELLTFTTASGIVRSREKIIKRSKNPFGMVRLFKHLHSEGHSLSIEGIVGDNVSFILIKGRL